MRWRTVVSIIPDTGNPIKSLLFHFGPFREMLGIDHLQWRTKVNSLHANNFLISKQTILRKTNHYIVYLNLFQYQVLFKVPL